MWINLTPDELAIVKQALSQKAGTHASFGRVEETKAVNQVQDRIKEFEVVGPEDAAIRQAAQDRYLRHPWTDGDVDIDEDATLSHGDGGTFVMAWVYVRDESTSDEGEE